MSNLTSNATRKLMSTNPPMRKRNMSPKPTVATLPEPPVAVKEPVVTLPTPPLVTCAVKPDAVQTSSADSVTVLGELKPGKTKLLWHKIGKAKPTSVTYVGRDTRGQILIHEVVNADGKVRLMAVPTWLLTRKGA